MKHDVHDDEDEPRPAVVTVTGDRITFPVLMEDGFGQIIVEHIRPGETRRVSINGRQVDVYRAFVH